MARYPTLDEVKAASPSRLRAWYRELPGPEDDLEDWLLMKICERLLEEHTPRWSMTWLKGLFSRKPPGEKQD